MPRGGARPGAGRPKGERKPKGKHGGARPGAGRPALDTDEHIRRGTYREARHGQRFADEHLRVTIEATDAKVHEIVGLSPRRRLPEPIGADLVILAKHLIAEDPGL